MSRDLSRSVEIVACEDVYGSIRVWFGSHMSAQTYNTVGESLNYLYTLVHFIPFLSSIKHELKSCSNNIEGTIVGLSYGAVSIKLQWASVLPQVQSRPVEPRSANDFTFHNMIEFYNISHASNHPSNPSQMAPCHQLTRQIKCSPQSY